MALLDEPALNRRNLLRLIGEQQTRNQFFVVTHTPALVRPESIGSVSRFALKAGVTHRYAFAKKDLEELDPQQREKLPVGRRPGRALQQRPRCPGGAGGTGGASVFRTPSSTTT